VEFGDTDMAGIVHFSRFFCYMESAEHELLRSLGLSVHMDWEGQRLTFPRVGASCDYLQSAAFEDVLTILTTVENVGRSSITYGFKFFLGEEAIARGQLTAVCCRVTHEHNLESVEIPDGIRAKLEATVS
jgi:YbgC/YbaW family acyl-CoA thioester hydrolase